MRNGFQRLKTRALVCIGLLVTAYGTGSHGQVVAQADADAAIRHAKTFTVSQHDGYQVVDLKASIVSWGAGAKGPEQRARVVLVPRGKPAPALTGDLDDASVIEVPVQRIAVNLAAFEAMLTALGVDERLVAVDGRRSYNDEIRERVFAGELAQIGYGWHSPPTLDALLGAKPELLLMSMGDLSHTAQMERIRSLGVPVIPLFIESEPHYMGRMEYIRLVGLLTGRDKQAREFVAMVERNVESLKTAAAAQPTKDVISAWYSGSGRWMATVRNSGAALLRDANARNLLQEPDDPLRDEIQKLGTEQMILRGRDADCAILRDSHSQPFRDQKTLEQFRAYREGCVFGALGMIKADVDAYDFYERAVIRPDLVLGDLVRMLHSELRQDEPFRYIQPEEIASE